MNELDDFQSPVLATEVGLMYLQVAHYSEGAIEPEQAIEIAEEIINARHPFRNKIDLLFRGHTRVWWQAQALREALARTNTDEPF